MNLGVLFSPVPLGARGGVEGWRGGKQRAESLRGRREGVRLPRCRRGRVGRRDSLGLGVRASAVVLCSRRGRGRGCGGVSGKG